MANGNPDEHRPTAVYKALETADQARKNFQKVTHPKPSSQIAFFLEHLRVLAAHAKVLNRAQNFDDCSQGQNPDSTKMSAVDYLALVHSYVDSASKAASNYRKQLGSPPSPTIDKLLKEIEQVATSADTIPLP